MKKTTIDDPGTQKGSNGISLAQIIMVALSVLLCFLMLNSLRSDTAARANSRLIYSAIEELRISGMNEAVTIKGSILSLNHEFIIERDQEGFVVKNVDDNLCVLVKALYIEKGGASKHEAYKSIIQDCEGSEDLHIII